MVLFKDTDRFMYVLNKPDGSYSSVIKDLIPRGPDRNFGLKFLNPNERGALRTVQGNLKSLYHDLFI